MFLETKVEGLFLDLLFFILTLEDQVQSDKEFLDSESCHRWQKITWHSLFRNDNTKIKIQKQTLV